MEEGRFRPSGNAFVADYFLKDHLGNVRMMIAEDGLVLEETSYYPFGLIQKGISTQASGSLINKKKFNGIEQTPDLDLNQYDAFFRTMDPQLGRWWQADPKPDYAQSLYSAMGNNPIMNMDFLGDTIRPIGTQVEIQRLNKALDIVSQTNPEDFAIVNNSSEDVQIGVADLNPNRKENSSNSNSSTSSTSTIKFGGGEERTDNNGQYSSTLAARGGVKQNPDGSFSKPGRADDGSVVMVNVNEQDANNLVKVESGSITIDVNLVKKDFMKTVAHEIGHAANEFENKAKSFFYKGDPALKGHDKGNPSGIRATNAESQFLRNYKKVK